jgi:hypothetical protein
MSAQPNVRRVRVRGVPCVAKFIVHRSPSGVHAPGGVSAKAGFDTEREVYRRLGRSWPVSLVDAFAARNGATSGYVNRDHGGPVGAVGHVRPVPSARREHRQAPRGSRALGRVPQERPFPPAVLGHDHRLREVGALDEPKRPTSAHSPRTSRGARTRAASRSAWSARCRSPPRTRRSRACSPPFAIAPFEPTH